MRVARFDGTFEGWQAAASPLLHSRLSPADILWIVETDSQASLFAPEEAPEPVAPPASRVRVSRRFMETARRVALHRDAERWRLLYRMVYRLTFEQPALLDIPTDADTLLLFAMDRDIRVDAHRMTAFLRFRRVAEIAAGETYVAWYVPDHNVLPVTAPFFADRFSGMTWSVFTPSCSAHWNGYELRLAEGTGSASVPENDELETLWRTYYAAVFNPARANSRLMTTHVPKRFWPLIPETSLVGELLEGAAGRVEDMVAKSHAVPSAAPFVPTTAGIDELRHASRSCQGCDLYLPATQTVFGEGPPDARLVFVGEQPGHVEDIQGRPFVGPAGQLFDRALSEAGIERAEVYVTNAVKHFKFIERGKRRIHQTPRLLEVSACRPWLQAELQSIRPRVVVCLGATAAKAIIRPQFRLMEERGRFYPGPLECELTATIHPSAVLRSQDDQQSAVLYRSLVADLRAAAERVAKAPVPS